MLNPTLNWPMVITFSALAASLVVYFDVPAPVRPLFTLWFVMICPGMAYVQLLHLREAVFEIVLAVALSLVLALLVAAAVLYAGFWSPALILLILVALSTVGVMFRLYQWFSLSAHAREQG